MASQRSSKKSLQVAVLDTVTESETDKRQMDNSGRIRSHDGFIVQSGAGKKEKENSTCRKDPSFVGILHL